MTNDEPFKRLAMKVSILPKSAVSTFVRDGPCTNRYKVFFGGGTERSRANMDQFSTPQKSPQKKWSEWGRAFLSETPVKKAHESIAPDRHSDLH